MVFQIQTYLTAKIKVDDIQNILAHDIGSERDAISGLRAPTNFGRPNWVSGECSSDVISLIAA